MAQTPQQPVYQAGGGGPSGPRAGFWRRFGAALLDGIILGVVSSIIAAILGGRSANGFNATYQGVNLLLGVVYFSYLEGGASGQTIGKRAAGIRVIDFGGGGPIGAGRALGRYFARFLSALPLGLGYFWMLWDREKQTWHDKLTTSVVVPTDAYPVENRA
jgi:uncharacterized RDD family membrane protein YckC